MFIAVINENFDVAEEQKRSRQATHFWATQRPQQARAAWIRRLNPYRWFAAKPKAIAVDQLPSNLVLPMQKSLVQDYTFAKKETRPVSISLHHFHLLVSLLTHFRMVWDERVRITYRQDH